MEGVKTDQRRKVPFKMFQMKLPVKYSIPNLAAF